MFQIFPTKLPLSKLVAEDSIWIIRSGMLGSLTRDFPRADMGENDVGAHGESTERPPEPWPGGKRRFTCLPTSISRSQAKDHGRDA